MLEPIETPRLLIRPFAPDDWRAVHAYAGDPAVMRYVPGGALTEEQARAFVAAGGGDEPSVAAVLKAEDRLIGHLPFHPWFHPQIWEIGWVFHPDYHRRGLATEAATALIRHGFEALGLHRIVATCQPENVASWRVMEKLGMQREACFRKGVQLDGATWLDEYLYALLEDDWFGEAGGAARAAPAGTSAAVG